MSPEDGPLENGNDVKLPVCYALRLGEGLEYAEFEPAQWRLTVYHVLGVSRQISLGYAEVYLLEYFTMHPGQMISRQQLIDHAWGDRVVSQGSLNQAVSNLRALLGDDQKREIIITVPRRGYQLNAEALVAWPDWLARKAEIIPPPSSGGRTREELPAREQPPVITPAKDRDRAWLMPTLWGMAALLSLLLVGGMFTRYFYTIWPPFAAEYSRSDKLRLTTLAKDQVELKETKSLLEPVIKRIEMLGGGTVLVNRAHNYVEFNCLRNDGTMRTLLVHIRRIQSLDNAYLSGCLR